MIPETYEDKIAHAQDIICDWYTSNNGKVYIAFSGGKDSTALLHMVRSLYPDVVAVFSNTGLEYPEIVAFAESFPNVITVRPKKSFVRVLQEDGFPLGSKAIANQAQALNDPAPSNFNTRRRALIGYVARTGVWKKRALLAPTWVNAVFDGIRITDKCCGYLKKDPLNTYKQESGNLPYIGMTMGEGNARDQRLLSRNCNVAGESSVPMKFFTPDDVHRYLTEHKLQVCKVYKENNLNRTGCTFCAYGAHLEQPQTNRFLQLQRSHPKQYNAFINKNNMAVGLSAVGISHGQSPVRPVAPPAKCTCQVCDEEMLVADIGFIDYDYTFNWNTEEHTPLAGMSVYCKRCAEKHGKPVKPF